MKARIRLIGLTLLPLTAMLLLFNAECNAQVQKMTAQELTLESTSILYGKCINTESAWTPDGEMIFTTVTVVPEYYLKGNMGSEVTITIPGGQVGDIIYEVSEMPAFRKGEEVFAFIWKHPSGLNLVTGGYQGKLQIGVDSQTGKRTLAGRHMGKAAPAKSIQEPAPTNLEPTKALQKATLSKTKSERISLDDFTKEVEGYLMER